MKVGNNFINSFFHNIVIIIEWHIYHDGIVASHYIDKYAEMWVSYS